MTYPAAIKKIGIIKIEIKNILPFQKKGPFLFKKSLKSGKVHN
jgi:hypothetical protein